ncbi:MAG TPA: PqiC family protein [Candidatus Binatia bacterium]|nr:PqiC family protein [Candidatus Binatia bacterium]
MDAARMRRAALLLLLALAPACRILPEAKPEGTRFYTLELPVPPSGSGDRAEPVALGLGPIIIPGYLDQPQMVTRLDDERIAFSSGDRWAGSLRSQFERALSLRLMSALGTDDVSLFPWWHGHRIDLSVQLNVLAFEPDSTGTARLDALWKVRNGQSQEIVRAGRVSLREPIGSGGTPAAVEALGRALDQLADAIAGDVQHARR